MDVLEIAVEKVRDEANDVNLRDAEGTEVYR